MLDFKDKTLIIGLGLVLVYAILAILGGMKSSLYILTYAALPSCYVFLYVSLGKQLGLVFAAVLALGSALVGGTNSLIYGSLYALLAYAIYYIMGFEGQQLKKFSLVVLVSLLLIIGSFVLLDYSLAGPSFVEEMNSMMKNPELMNQLARTIAKNSPGAEVLIVDQNLLKLAISTLLPLFLFLMALGIAMLNYPLINALRRRLDRSIEAVPPLWRLGIPYPLVLSLVLVGMLGMMMPDIEKGFGGGLFISAYLLNSTFFVLQGLFLLAFFMQAYGLNTKYIPAICISILVTALVLGLQLVIMLLLYGGLIDLLFDLRKLRKRGRGI